MQIEILPHSFTVCKIHDLTDADLSAPFCFLSKTDNELSLVCPTEHAPAETAEREDGWRMMRISGQLDFSLIGILARIAGILADAGISIFAVSTYNTDYILTKEANFERASALLQTSGYEITQIDTTGADAVINRTE